MTRDSRETRAGVAAGVLLIALYVATLAPAVTFWDAGELAAAAATLGIPHPPGTPLYVAAAHLWARAVGAPSLVSWAVGAALFSAACTAAAGALLGALVARWTRSAVAGVAAALAAGATSSVWANATETEVYAASLLLAAAMLWCGDRRAREPEAGRGARWTLLLAYLFVLTPALHLSALVASPAAIVLAAVPLDGSRGVRWREGALLCAAAVLGAGVGTASPSLVAVAALGFGALAVFPAAPPLRRRTLAAAAALGVAGASALLVMLVRARHDPALNQGDPSSFARLLDVVGRHQYEKVGLLPRRAPLWLQLGNVFEYADWQWALGLSGGVAPSWMRTPFTLLYAVLGWFGAREHRRLDRRSWLALAALALGGSLGVALYLNLKAGPSFGVGILPESAPHEARERDYFFVLGFWAWGAWAGLGAARLAARRGGAGRAALVLAALPVLLNWRAASRRGEPEASLARTLAVTMLRSAPPRAVVFTAGDNDSYPLWYAQLALGERRDVRVVTVPLLGAPWYRAELARRDSLIAPDDVPRWEGQGRAMAAIADAARRAGRPVAASVALPAAERAPAGAPRTAWSLRGLVWVARPADAAAAGPDVAWATADDSATTAALADQLRSVLRAAPRPSPDGASRAMQALLACPAIAIAAARVGDARSGAGAATESAAAAPDSAATVLLDSRCNRR